MDVLLSVSELNRILVDILLSVSGINELAQRYNSVKGHQLTKTKTCSLSKIVIHVRGKSSGRLGTHLTGS